MRAATDRLDADQLSAPTYEDLNRNLLAIADAIPELMTDVELGASARAAAAIATAEHLAAQERDLLRGVFRRGAFQPGELATLASLTGAENERLAEFNRYATNSQRDEYTSLMSAEDVATAGRIAGAALVADRQPAALKIDPDTWYIAQSNTVRRLHLLEVDLARWLDHSALIDEDLAQTRAAVTGLSTAGLVVLAFGTALALAVRTARRLRALRGAALDVAGVELPGTIAAMTKAGDVRSVQAAMHAAASRADSLEVSGSDEIAEVGTALTAVHRQALHLAAEQASLRLDVAALFVALSRRGQTLIQRQLRLLDEFERSETDPQTLSRLFALDHLAARMRRNEENLLVLAGGEPGRRVLSPVPLVDLIRAAAAEIEDFQRVDADNVTEVGVAAHVVRDVIHLLAELMENATMFSPPTSKVRVSARRSVDSVTISVFDEGIGMPQHQVEELNARLARPTMLTAELAGTMGLLVVGRLAIRHGIAVELRSTAPGGTVALVTLPNSILAPAPPFTTHATSLLYPEPAAIESRTGSSGLVDGRDSGPWAPEPDSMPLTWPMTSVAASEGTETARDHDEGWGAGASRESDTSSGSGPGDAADGAGESSDLAEFAAGAPDLAPAESPDAGQPEIPAGVDTGSVLDGSAGPDPASGAAEVVAVDAGDPAGPGVGGVPSGAGAAGSGWDAGTGPAATAGSDTASGWSAGTGEVAAGAASPVAEGRPVEGAGAPSPVAGSDAAADGLARSGAGAAIPSGADLPAEPAANGGGNGSALRPGGGPLPRRRPAGPDAVQAAPVPGD
ncbi:MAG TPA: nitrate- and nitrite sensing domain-containing protein, partial [Rugosimonospora sp.]|nr:nitrate- and nitrite sensing domain-containing protein [Rugosimonospora sp.]